MKNSFIKGAAILMVANAVSKILGAVLKIPLTYIIHEEGMAVYNTAFGVYAMFLAFIMSGVPFAVSKMCAAELAKDNPNGAKSIVWYSSVILFIAGLLGSLVMWFGADFFALAMKEERAVWAIRAVAPSVLLVAVGDAVKSGFQGESNMLPTAVSQCIESFIKLAAGYFFAVWLIGCGTDKSAAGAIFGVTVGELCATVMLVGSYCVTHRKIKRERGKSRLYSRELIETAMPVMLMAVTGSALAVVDTSVLRASLLRAGLSRLSARYLYGAYTGYAMTVLNLPSGFLATLGVSIIPAISASVATGNDSRVRRLTKNGLLLSAVCGISASAVIAVFGDFILNLLFHNTTSSLLLRISAPSVFFICMMQLSGAILQAMGYTGRVFISSVTVGVIKLLSAIFLVSIPEINIYGAAIGSDIAFFVGMVMNFIFLSCVGTCKTD
ncbi:MAG: polysaccharide biosynthesis protein, partial [Clostridia bacterium]|nr:polysaccharide biosynthesis protein [Clostridia bacterium]